LAKQWRTPPEMTIDPRKHYYARLETDLGTMVIQLFADRAPVTVNNFVFLTKEGFYDGTTFHRVIKDFMAQGGDPTASGSGGPGYRFADEFNRTLRHEKPGVVSMANAGPNTNGSQFFITYAAAPWLDDKHAVFGYLIEGLDVLNSIPPRDPARSGQPGVKIKKATIEERST
jgi:peptidyl-prolyl cis-trans isomerase B (cyclophilin B)